ncbi:DUF302 domain-containing protein [Sulfurimonas sp.]|jgi:uncharacterized protein (DUF302 family)|uniref:DUF302 domain-containing protein n=1 Tax=Sulfurimonas sp. TaxID=2022749 RepID=UPI0025DED503|nr:DUF302 domain-containing protein [Sulfurimonas sp.]MBT5933911.1 DUF302 domain-containing protein [Sulfurimonas sp.]
MLYTVKSNVDLKTIKDEIPEKAKDNGLGILNEYPFKDILKAKGHPIEQDITVYELCNPVTAEEVLSKYPEVSVYLPCRVSVYEKDGQVILSTVEMDEITKNFDIDDMVKNHMNEVFHNLKKMLNSWN